MTPDLSLYLVTDSQMLRRAGHDPVEAILAAIDGGITAVQVRDKGDEPGQVLRMVSALAPELPAHVSLVINDHLEVFQAARERGLRVDGIHLGQEDTPPEQAREVIGPDALIGLTAHTPAQLEAAAASPAGIGYVGIGAVRATASKPDAAPAIGVEGVTRLARSTPLRAVAIGGIVATDLPALRTGGLAGVAVVSAICAAPDPRSAAAHLSTVWGTA